MMNPKKLVLTTILILYFLNALSLCHASIQANHTFSGHIKTNITSGAAIPQFSVKLYPPKESYKPVLITTTDDSGNFQFTELSEKSYLLEIYLGTDMVYQEVIGITESICCEIDLSGETSKRECPCPRPRTRRRR